MAKPLRVGVISANWGMLAHLPAWHAIEDVEVAAVCTSRRETAEAAAAQFGIAKAYWNHADMAADPDLDIVDAGTRPDLRRDMVLTALANGKHVFAAANFAATIEGAREMRDAARQSGLVCALDSTIAQAPAHRQLAQMMADGYLGRPVSVTARHVISLFNNGPAPAGDYWRWFGKRSHGASAMRNLGTHSLHLLVHLLGPVVAVTAQATIGLREWKFPDGERIQPETEDMAHLLVQFANGVLGNVTLGWASPALSGFEMEISGDDGTLITRDPGFFPTSDTIQLFAGRHGAPADPVALSPDLLHSPTLHLPKDLNFPHSADIARVMETMVTAIRHGGRPDPDFETAYHVEAILEGARRAIEERRWVELSEIG